MGKPMAKNLLKGHYKVKVASRSQPPVDELCQLGALRVIDVAELATWADLVITMLPTPSVTAEVVLGRGALVENMSVQVPS